MPNKMSAGPNNINPRLNKPMPAKYCVLRYFFARRTSSQQANRHPRQMVAIQRRGQARGVVQGPLATIARSSRCAQFRFPRHGDRR